MSGRLVILPKKTYCPWNPENVERVLRDERLERERLEREAKRLEEGRRERGRGGERGGDRVGGGDRDDGESERAADGGHVNLFPEAREAELRAATMGGKQQGNYSSEKKEVGVMPVPLGGDEASRRREGAAPFYLRSRRDGVGEGGKYGDASSSRAFRLGERNSGGRAAADEITARITQDQFDRREDGRKDLMDPIARFFAPSLRNRVAEKCISASAGTGSAPPREGRGLGSCDPSLEQGGTKNDLSPHKRRVGKGGSGDGRGKKRNKSHIQRAGFKSLSDNDSFLLSSSSESSLGSEAGEHCRRHIRRKDDRNGHRKSRKRRRKESRRHRRSHRRDVSPPAKNKLESGLGGREEDLEELRRRRREREARESERERSLMGMAAPTLPHSGHYQDQFNPALSRN